MLGNKSRYLDTRPYAPTGAGKLPLRGGRPREITPVEGVLEHRVQQGDRIDLLALNYYGDSQQWWRIMDANPQLWYGGEVGLDDMAGRIILIPGVGR